MNEDRDLLISLIASADASPEQWQQLTERAADDADLWREVAVAQRQHALMSQAMDRAVSVADDVPLPADPSWSMSQPVSGFRSPYARSRPSGDTDSGY